MSTFTAVEIHSHTNERCWWINVREGDTIVASGEVGDPNSENFCLEGELAAFHSHLDSIKEAIANELTAIQF